MKRVCIILSSIFMLTMVGCSSGEVSGDLSADNLFGSETMVTESTTEQEPSTSPSATTTTAAEEIEEVIPVIGIEEGSNVSLKIGNESGKTITSMFIKEHDEDGYDDTDLIEVAFEDGEVRDAFFFLDEEKTYDLKIVFDDGEEEEIEKLYLGYIPEGTILYDDEKCIFDHEPLEIEIEPAETTKKKKNPNNGCIGDEGVLY